MIPVFPGTNCEYDSKRAFERAGATVQLVLMRNKTAKEMKDSVDELEAAIRQSQIMMLPVDLVPGMNQKVLVSLLQRY